MSFKHIGLFEGIGGFSLAARWMGWETVAWCEWNDFGQKVLKYHFPEAEGFGDITKTDFTKYANSIDILTGGFPCQPYSLAGKRKGKDDERHLWPEMLRAIREIKPRWVVGENVLGLVNWNGGLVFDEVQADLEAQGYEVQPYILPACAKNAPHRRDRVWFVAYNHSFGHQSKGQVEPAIWNTGNGEGWTTTNTQSQRSAKLAKYGEFSRSGPITDTAVGVGCEGRMYQEGREAPERHISTRNAQNYGGNDWQDFPTQSPVCNGDDGISTRLDFTAVWRGVKPRNPRQYPEGYITFAKWRAESIKAGGNAIVPEVAFEIYKAIQQYELQINAGY